MTQRNTKRVLCLVGTRPECIKMAPVIKALQQESWAEPVVVSTGQHREMVQQVLSLFNIRVDHDLDVMVPNQTLSGLSSKIFAKLDPLLTAENFDLVLVQGDTTSVMVAALAAFYHRIPIGHVEAGLRTHDIERPFPEELNRVVTGLVTQLHFAPTVRARENLLREGKPAHSVHVTGNTVVDALLDVAGRDLPCGFPTSPDRRLILMTAHRRENFGQPILEICAALREIHDRFPDLEFVYPVHPNPNIREPVYAALEGLERVHLIAPADYEALIMLMKRSTLILTDSGGIQEEAPALGKPVLVLRDETERPEAVEAGVAKLVGARRERIVAEAARLLTDEAAYSAMARAGSPYGDGTAARRIVAICNEFLLR
ncbi:non-hydrolyzing UDP-N-acetylglucosamine 2-epimerase [Microvirga makkahensis]|uniref:UDP-N-acetylglucosamine 2-epimerase (non-hydrolyzing) n=1 Tax=Microvirga makkahensis TaxID=1128670 RepID=A0A7X3SQ50_9HYPH|nr:UDP-N-acetylglucosamine 2-epimerase (non-hydrolyzing) [Microvirga makkahensis]MXQ12888.1 UDP-N-acetylglucosamine 2-epimerase (non-hydrolyzing) [Microvirga makkahensis]